MWVLDNQTPFAAERGWIRDGDGAEIWLVGVKASFLLLDDGGTQIMDEQVPVHLAPEFHGDPATTSLSHDADLVWGKPGTDILLQGSAHSCEGPRNELPVAFQIGPVRRQAAIIGERVWERVAGGSVIASRPRPFATMPLRWEQSFGGTDASDSPPAWESRNPVGRGFSRHRTQPPGFALPTLEQPRERMRSPADRPTPIGFGPIARHWHPRTAFAGTYDDVWMRDRRPLLPRDFDARYQFSAPAEQQVPGHLRGGEEVRLANLHPRVPRYRCELPHVDLRFRTRFRGQGIVEHLAKLTSVIVDTDQTTLAMVWVSELPCHHLVQRLLETEIELVPRVRVAAGRREVDA